MRKLFVISAGIGCGATFVLAAAALSFFWYTNRLVKAPPWNQTAITAKYSDLYLIPGQPLIMSFRYTIENHTDHDYELPGDASIYKVLAQEKGLEHDPSLKWEEKTSVLAGQKINIGIHVEYQYDGNSNDFGNEKLSAFTKRRLAEIDGFAALDEASRYEIKFPKPPEKK